MNPFNGIRCRHYSLKLPTTAPALTTAKFIFLKLSVHCFLSQHLRNTLRDLFIMIIGFCDILIISLCTNTDIREFLATRRDLNHTLITQSNNNVRLGVHLFVSLWKGTQSFGIV